MCLKLTLQSWPGLERSSTLLTSNLFKDTFIFRWKWTGMSLLQGKSSFVEEHKIFHLPVFFHQLGGRDPISCLKLEPSIRILCGSHCPRQRAVAMGNARIPLLPLPMISSYSVGQQGVGEQKGLLGMGPGPHVPVQYWTLSPGSSACLESALTTPWYSQSSYLFILRQLGFSGWAWTYFVAQASLELAIPLAQSPR